MTRRHAVVISVAMLSLMTMAHPTAHAEALSKVDYEAKEDQVEASYKRDKAACAMQAGNTRDICTAQAKAREQIGVAELRYAFTGQPAHRNSLLAISAKAHYAVARERCDDKADDAKELCIQEATAAESKALADARRGKGINGAGKH